jgi:hypothetical protein
MHVSLFQINTVIIPKWMMYNFSDGLWIFSFTSIMFYIWRNETANMYIWILSPLLIAFCFEFGQKIKLINGTFDAYDLISYVLGSVLSILANLKFNKLPQLSLVSKRVSNMYSASCRLFCIPKPYIL